MAGLHRTLLLLVCSCATAAVAAGGEAQWCGSVVDGGDKDKTCPVLNVDTKGCKESFKDTTSVPASDQDRFKVKAVYYEPRPIGVDPNTADIYDDDYNALHRRDLYIIKKVLGANTVRLGPWSVDYSNEHYKFIELCKEAGLFIIPTFDLGYFITTEEMRNKPWDKRMQEMEKKFKDFMQHVGGDAPVLMWSINHGLLLNETSANGELSRNTPNTKRNEYFQFLEAIRKTHHNTEWDPKMLRYRRPLALPLLLDTYNKIAEINWYMKLTETYWDRWSQKQHDDKRDPPWEHGSFDVWIAETIAQPKDEIINIAKFLHVRPDTEDCEEIDDECGYNTKKVVMLQYGFSALSSGTYMSSRETRPTVQQESLKAIWDVVKAPDTNNEHCLQGGVIDEWVDDWERCASLGYASSGYMHNMGGECSQVKLSVGQTHLEWFGLNSQYSWLFQHCISPRFATPDGFRFAGYDEATDKAAWIAVAEEGIHMCAMKWPPTWKLWRCGFFVFSFVFILIWRSTHLKKQETQTMELEEEAQDSQAGTSHESGNSPHRATVMLNSSPLSNASPTHNSHENRRATTRMTAVSGESRVVVDSVKLQVPSFLCEDRSFQFILEVKDPREFMDAATAAKKKIDKFTKDQVRFIITAHSKAQARRLQHQIEHEAYAVQDKCRRASAQLKVTEGLDTCYDQAMRNVHSKALEGYVSWLVDQAERKPDKEEFRDACNEMLDNSTRNTWELWVEALLLRTMESLSEQLLHSPELVHAIYHRTRQPDGQQWDREHANFTIDYRLLHKGIEELKDKPNPYEGGVNFDDLNDCGRRNEPDLKPVKTYQESTGLWVVIDIVSNFLPVICTKMWLFFLAWYLYLILKSVRTTDTRNGTFLHPAFLAGNAIQIFAFGDACIGVFVEGVILAHGMSAGRRNWEGFKLWLTRHLATLILCSVGGVLLFNELDIKDIEWDWKPSEADDPKNKPTDETIKVCFGYWAVRVVVFLIVNTVLNKWLGGKGAAFIPGKPTERKNPEVGGVTAEGELDTGNSSNSLDAMGGMKAQKYSEFLEKSDDVKVRAARRVAWLCMLGGCFVFEIFFIAPLAADFDTNEFCKISCEEKVEMANVASGTIMGLPDFMSLANVGNDCWACRGTLVITWTLVGLTGFFDIYYMFYFGTAVVGYGMGEARGLRNVLSTALRYLDFSTRTTSQKVMSTMKKMQQFSDGELMCRVFGTSWRVIWSRLVESLFEECLINAKERDNLVKAAGTMPWAKRRDRDNLKPGDTFEALKFVSTASRGSNRVIGADVGHERTKCISGLLIRENQTGEVHTMMVDPSDFATKEVTIANKSDRDKVTGVLLIDNKDNPDRSVLEVTAPVTIGSGDDQVTIKEKWRIVGAPDSDLGDGNLEDDALNIFTGLETFPAKVIFKTTSKYNECVLKLDRPYHVHAVSFLKTMDDPAMDPTQWRVEGLQTQAGSNEVGGKDSQWKQLVWQDTTVEPRSHGRGEPTQEWFEVECWRLKNKNPATVDFNNLDPIVAERLGFFAASLNSIVHDMDHPVRQGVDSLLDSHIGNVPSLSQIIPVYGETVIIDEKNLMLNDGVNTNLGFIISQYDNEWENFAKKFGKDPDSLYQDFASGRLREKADSEDRHNPSRAREAADLIMEIRLWASMRSQTVSRTVVGAIQYHEVLSLMPGIKKANDTNGDSPPSEDDRMPRENIEKCVELILAHQTYGQKRKDDKKGPADSDKDVQYLLKKYSDKPFYLVLDYNDKTAEAGLQQKVHSFMHSAHQYSGKVQFASVLARWRQLGGGNIADEDGLEIVEVLPRRFPLLVGEGDFRTQGKAGNQLGALRFARGHYLQMMDSNMGAFLGEACKVPFVLRRFCPFNFNRASVTARIIGFREFIFTEQHGTVGNIMASAEFSFGTICQRFLAGLGARMHYGHPDFLDGFWASNRGSLSKASPSINLSEDIFAGFNVAMRGEKSMHVDTLAWEKGREASFNASSLFFSKVSGGNAGVMRSRDLKIISENTSISENFSFYFASIGFYLNNLLIDQSVMLYVVLFVLLSLSSKSLEEVGDRYSLLATEWVMSMGIVAMFPRFMELTLEYGILEGILRFVPSVPGCMTMFTFINKSIASAVKETMMTGKAHYISTGRPNANTHYGWRECYFIFCKSHYYPALNVCFCYLLYYLLASKLNLDSLPMMVLMFSVLLWIVAPIIFCPQPTVKTLCKDLSEYWQFCIATPQWSVRKMPLNDKNTEDMLNAAMNNPRSTLYEYWLLEELKSKQTPLLLRILFVIGNYFKTLVLLAVVHTAMLDSMFHLIVIFSAQLLLMECWRLLYRPTALMMLIMIAGFVLPLWWLRIPPADYMVVLAVFNYGLRCFHDFALLVASFVYRPDNSWTKWDTSTEENRKKRSDKRFNTRRYDLICEYFFVNFQQHLQHLYCSVFILLLNLVAQLPMIVLDMFGGIHSGLLLNYNLCGYVGPKRPGYEPPPAGEDSADGGVRRKARRRASSTASNALSFLTGSRVGMAAQQQPGRHGQDPAAANVELQQLRTFPMGGADGNARQAQQQQLLRRSGGLAE